MHHNSEELEIISGKTALFGDKRLCDKSPVLSQRLFGSEELQVRADLNDLS